MSSDNRSWSVAISVDKIPETGGHYELTADLAAREAVARAAGVRQVEHLDAVFELTRRGADVVAKGEVRARVGQTCVVTLEPIESDIRESVDLVFAPPSEFAVAHQRRDEPLEQLENGIIDLGAVATEFLMLGLDPYPRKPGVQFAAAPGEKKGE